MESKQQEVEGWDDDDYVRMTDKGETSGSGLRSRIQDLGCADSGLSSRDQCGDAAEHGFPLASKTLESGCLGGL